MIKNYFFLMTIFICYSTLLTALPDKNRAGFCSASYIRCLNSKRKNDHEQKPNAIENQRFTKRPASTFTAQRILSQNYFGVLSTQNS